MFKYLITVQPLGFMYGSAGAFLSPENLVGKSGSKFPPDAATLSGLFFSSNKDQQFANNEELRDELYVAGPFWSMVGNEEYFYVPLPRHKVIGEDDNDEWLIKSYNWCLKSKAETVEEQPSEKKKESEYHWLKIDYWHSEPQEIQENRNANPPSVAAKCWEYLPILHPQIKKDERHVLPEDGLFLETAVQMKDDTCLVYLSTYPLTDGWYQFGGESHIVEIKSIELPDDSPILELLRTPIKRTFALITPGLWGSNHCSYRYPKQPDFSTDNNKIKLLTDKAVPYRYRIGYGDQKKEEYSTRTQGRLSRGRYAVPVGSVYALKDPLNKNWWDFPPKWFPEKGLLKKFGCGLCLPIKVQGVDD